MSVGDLDQSYYDGASEVIQVDRIHIILFMHLIQEKVNHTLVLLGDRPLQPLHLVLLDDLRAKRIQAHPQLLHPLLRASQVHRPQPRQVIRNHECA